MANRMVIRKTNFRNTTICDICRKPFEGDGFTEKCIAGYTPEGYLLTDRFYCMACGTGRMEKLISENRQYANQFPEE